MRAGGEDEVDGVGCLRVGEEGNFRTVGETGEKDAAEVRVFVEVVIGGRFDEMPGSDVREGDAMRGRDVRNAGVGIVGGIEGFSVDRSEAGGLDGLVSFRLADAVRARGVDLHVVEVRAVPAGTLPEKNASVSDVRLEAGNPSPIWIGRVVRGIRPVAGADDARTEQGQFGEGRENDDNEEKRVASLSVSDAACREEPATEGDDAGGGPRRPELAFVVEPDGTFRHPVGTPDLVRGKPFQCIVLDFRKERGFQNLENYACDKPENASRSKEQENASPRARRFVLRLPVKPPCREPGGADRRENEASVGIPRRERSERDGEEQDEEQLREPRSVTTEEREQRENEHRSSDELDFVEVAAECFEAV